MSDRIINHVIRSTNGNWIIKRNGAAKGSSVFETKAAAVQAAKQISKDKGADLYIHAIDGRVDSIKSYNHTVISTKSR